MWDDRYRETDLAYGDQPNDFLTNAADRLSRGTCLCLAEGQGRNAVWLAQQGFDVTALDQSAEGMRRAEELAFSRGVTIRTIVADLDDFDLGEARWDSIVSIFGHLPSPLRRKVHSAVVRALKPGGTFLLESYTPDQLTTSGSGGPRDPDMMPTKALLSDELAGLDFEIAQEIRREVNEGSYHRGEAAVVQIVARKGMGD
jgi:SAM-dependent methyltransferase